jgi:hypothetical protein
MDYKMVATITAALFPTLAVLIGILVNRQDAIRLDARITTLEASLRAELANMSVRISKAGDQAHSDVMMLLGRDQEMDKRVTRIEGRQ